MQLIYPHSNLNVLNTLHSAVTESLSMSWIVCVVQLLCSGRGVRTQEEGHTALAMKRERRKQRQCGKWYDDKGREHGLREKKCRLDVCSFPKDCKNRNPQHIAGAQLVCPWTLQLVCFIGDWLLWSSVSSFLLEAGVYASSDREGVHGARLERSFLSRWMQTAGRTATLHLWHVASAQTENKAKPLLLISEHSLSNLIKSWVKIKRNSQNDKQIETSTTLHRCTKTSGFFFNFYLISAFSSSITYLVSVLWAWCQAWGQDDGWGSWVLCWLVSGPQTPGHIPDSKRTIHGILNACEERTWMWDWMCCASSSQAVVQLSASLLRRKKKVAFVLLHFHSGPFML